MSVKQEDEMLTFADRVAMRLMKVRTLLYALEIIASSADGIGEDDESRIANLIGVITDEIDEAEKTLEKCDFIERGENN